MSWRKGSSSSVAGAEDNVCLVSHVGSQIVQTLHRWRTRLHERKTAKSSKRLNRRQLRVVKNSPAFGRCAQVRVHAGLLLT
jgi:hypothetical protein